jgi:hypothetical protein
MAQAERQTSAQQQLAETHPGVPARIVDSILSAFRAVTPTLPDAVRATQRRLDDACAPLMTSSIGAHSDVDATSVAIYLSERDIERISAGIAVDLETPDGCGGTLSVHMRRERRLTDRTLPATPRRNGHPRPQ